jgi:hypothetical protein
MLSVPWRWTDLPVPHADDEHYIDDGSISLLSPTALRDLVRFVRGRGQPELAHSESPD